MDVPEKSHTEYAISFASEQGCKSFKFQILCVIMNQEEHVIKLASSWGLSQTDDK